MAHFHDSAFPHADQPVPFTTEGTSTDCRLAITLRAGRLNLNRLLDLDPLLGRANADEGKRDDAEKSDCPTIFVQKSRLLSLRI
jgi:hypothetical protein